METKTSRIAKYYGRASCVSAPCCRIFEKTSGKEYENRHLKPSVIVHFRFAINDQEIWFVKHGTLSRENSVRCLLSEMDSHQVYAALN